MVERDPERICDLLQGVREGPVADIVQERGEDGVLAFTFAFIEGRCLGRVARDRVEHGGGDAGRTDRVGESRVLRAVKHQVHDPVLADSAEALEDRCVEERLEEPLEPAAREADIAVDRIAEYPWPSWEYSAHVMCVHACSVAVKPGSAVR